MSPISQRPGPRPVIAEKFVELFNQYENDLEEVIEIYEAGKDSPPLLRNAPPVSLCSKSQSCNTIHFSLMSEKFTSLIFLDFFFALYIQHTSKYRYYTMKTNTLK